MARVVVKDLFKRFGKVVAVDHVSFEVKDGEFMVLLGPSGCGKTTTLLMIAGVYKPTRGYIYFDDQVVNDLEPKDRNIGMVFQSYALYPHMTVYENIAFPLKLKKLPKEEIDRRVREVASMLKIENLLDRRPSQLSGGQQQRVALARTIVKRPGLFLMDEPLSNLDAKIRVEVRAELKRLQRELGITTIYVTHDQAEAMTMADRVAVMNEGKIMQLAEPHVLYHKPANLFVAGFIGAPAMNFLDASVNVRDGEVELDTGVFRIRLPRSLSEVLVRAGPPSEVVFGIRPEHITVSKSPIPGGYQVEVFVTEPLGSETIIDFKHGDQLVKVRYPGGFEAVPGEKVYIAFQLEQAHIFDKKTGNAIV
jgi:multiple sugar transport system ATP-binding protein